MDPYDSPLRSPFLTKNQSDLGGIWDSKLRVREFEGLGCRLGVLSLVGFGV